MNFLSHLFRWMLWAAGLCPFSCLAQGLEKTYFNETYSWTVALPEKWTLALPGGPAERIPNPTFSGPSNCHKEKKNCYLLSFRFSKDGVAFETHIQKLIQRREKTHRTLTKDKVSIGSMQANRFSYQVKKSGEKEYTYHFIYDYIFKPEPDSFLLVSFSKKIPSHDLQNSRMDEIDETIVTKIISSFKKRKNENDLWEPPEKFESPTKEFRGLVAKSKNSFSGKFKILLENKNKKRIMEKIDYFQYDTSKQFIKKMKWGPKEVLLLLPDIGWQTYASSENITVVNLGQNKNWQTANWQATDHLWLDPSTIVGNRHGDCDYNVVTFDGMTGKTHILKANKDIYGWKVVKKTEPGILIAKVANNCTINPPKPGECILYTSEKQLLTSELCEQLEKK